MSKKVCIVDIGYQKYACPLSFVEQLWELRRIGYKYKNGKYIYWMEGKNDTELSLTMIDADSILASEPEEDEPKPTAQATQAQPKKDDRILVAPSDDPITIGAVPPMRDFVDEYRDQAND